MVPEKKVFEMSLRSILDLKKGERSCIAGVQGTGSIRQRLLDMGLMPRQSIELTRIAPGGAPLWIQIGSSHLALRREEAALVLLSDGELASGKA